jgi:hypothetical protein
MDVMAGVVVVPAGVVLGDVLLGGTLLVDLVLEALLLDFSVVFAAIFNYTTYRLEGG